MSNEMSAGLRAGDYGKCGVWKAKVAAVETRNHQTPGGGKTQI